MTSQPNTNPAEKNMQALENALIRGDLATLSADARVFYYNKLCDSLGLNPLTKPFDYIVLNGKLALYANKSCTEQLRAIHNVSIDTLEAKEINGIYVVTAHASLPSGRKDASTGATSIAGLKGEALCNQIMKCETKAKRRATLSICGLAMLDESELETIPKSAITPVAQPEIPSNAYGRLLVLSSSHPDLIEYCLRRCGVEQIEDIPTRMLSNCFNYIEGELAKAPPILAEFVECSTEQPSLDTLEMTQRS